MKFFTRLRIFLKVVETESFSEASRQLGISQPSVSRQISALEQELEVLLLHRTTHRVSLTEAGEMYYKRVRRIVEDLDNINESISEISEHPTGTLSLSVHQAFGQFVLANILPQFQKRYPKLEIQLSMNDRVIDLLEENVDLALRVGPLKDSSMIARKLVVNRFITCASPEYIQEFGMPLIPEDLVNHNCFIFEHPLNPTIWRFQGPEKQHEISVSGNLRTNMVQAIMEGVLAGGGISWFPYWFVHKEIQKGNLEIILPEYEVFVGGFELFYIYVLYPDKRFLPEKVRAFIDFLVEALKKIETESEYKSC